jgi:hypothetical protein
MKETPMKRSPPLIAAALLALGLVVTACSGRPVSPGSITASGKAAGALAYASCMRHHGFPDFPDPHPAIGTDGKPGAALSVPGDINQN